MRQFFDKLSLIHINSVVHTDFFKCLNADWQVSRFVHNFNITYFLGIVRERKTFAYKRFD